MKQSTEKILSELTERYPALKQCKEDILAAYLILEEAYESGKKLLVCGNGGSAADSEHIVGELMKKFKKPRGIKKEVYDTLANYGEEGKRLQRTLEGTLRAVSLTSHLSLTTAFANDREPAACFAQQLYGLADAGDALIAISTSGNSENCVLAAVTAKASGMKTIALTGAKESKLSALCEAAIRVPETETFKVQELHLPVYHCLCAMLEEEFF